MSFGDDEEKETLPTGQVVESNNGSTDQLRLASGPFDNWMSDAGIEAYRKLRKDLRTSGEPSKDRDLRAYATEVGEAKLHDFPGIDRQGKSIFQLVSMYADTFVKSYGEHLREGRASGAIPDETTMRVQGKAREDGSLSLNATQLPIYGTIRASEQLLRITVPPEIFGRVEQLAVAYEQEYAKQKEVGRDSFNSSGPFLDA